LDEYSAPWLASSKKMNETTITLHVGLADFSEPTLLLLGDAAALNWLADRIAIRQSLDLSTSSFVKLHGVVVKLEAVDDGELCQRKKSFTWRISPNESQQFVQQLRMLAASDIPAHAYLDPASNSAGLDVMASKGEYIVDDIFID
jgi:hypothetical protein